MIVYIAGKMSGLPDKGREAFALAEAYIKANGHIALNPAWLPDGMEPEQYLPICMAMLDQADCIAMIKGWEDSDGARLEHDYAVYQNKIVSYLPVLC